MNFDIKMCHIWRVLLICVWVMDSQAQTSQGTCKKVMRRAPVLCVDSEDSTGVVDCPSGSQVLIHRAVAYKSSRSSDAGRCPNGIPEDDQQCTLGLVTSDVRKQCAQLPLTCSPDVMSTCYFTLAQSDLDESTCAGVYGSDPYVVVDYSCSPAFDPLAGAPTPEKALAMQIDKQFTHQGSKVHIDSSNKWLQNVGGTVKFDYRKRIDKGCCVNVPAGTEMITFPYVFLKNPVSESSSCAQRIVVTETESGAVENHCKNSTEPKRYDCHPEDRAFFVQYLSSDYSISSVFVFSAQVSLSGEFSVACGMKKEDCKAGAPITPPTTTTTTTNPGSVTTTGGSSSTTPGPSAEEINWMAILIGLAIALLLILILIIACVLCLRKSPQDNYVYVDTDPSEASVSKMYFPGGEDQELYYNTVKRRQVAVAPMYDAASMSAKLEPPSMILLSPDQAIMGGEQVVGEEQYITTLVPAEQQQPGGNVLYSTYI